jgi:hypothetical protein
MDTIKIKPWHESQGDHVVINKGDFDPDKHELLDGEAEVSVDIEVSGDAPVRRGRKPKAE